MLGFKLDLGILKYFDLTNDSKEAVSNPKTLTLACVGVDLVMQCAVPYIVEEDAVLGLEAIDLVYCSYEEVPSVERHSNRCP